MRSARERGRRAGTVDKAALTTPPSPETAQTQGPVPDFLLLFPFLNNLSFFLSSLGRGEVLPFFSPARRQTNKQTNTPVNSPCVEKQKQRKPKVCKFTTSRSSREVLGLNSPRATTRGFVSSARWTLGLKRDIQLFYFSFFFFLVFFRIRGETRRAVSSRRAEESSSEEPAGARPARGTRLTRRTAARRQGSGGSGAGIPAETHSRLFLT